jgi:hypothetical protein
MFPQTNDNLLYFNKHHVAKFTIYTAARHHRQEGRLHILLSAAGASTEKANKQGRSFDATFFIYNKELPSNLLRYLHEGVDLD